MIFIMFQAIENESDQIRLANFYLKYYGLLKMKAQLVLSQFHISNTSNLAEDMIHDGIAKMIQNINTVSKLSDPQLVAYGVKAVQSCTTDYCRKMISHQKLIEAKGILEGVEENKVWEDHINIFAQENPLDYLGQILESLPQRDKDILIYKYFLKYDDKTIAGLLDIQENSVRMALTRARKKVREVWNEIKEEREGNRL